MFGEMFSWMFMPSAPIERTEVNGWEVSTVDTPDEGPETAIIDGQGGVHPVERYESVKDAIVGHNKWVSLCEKSDELTVQSLGGFVGLLEDETITISNGGGERNP